MEQQACPILHEPGNTIYTGNKSRGHPQVSLCQVKDARPAELLNTCNHLTLLLHRQMVQHGSITSDQAAHITGLYDMLGGLDVHNAVGIFVLKSSTSSIALYCLAWQS